MQCVAFLFGLCPSRELLESFAFEFCFCHVHGALCCPTSLRFYSAVQISPAHD
jgi:hypothetical protein